MFCILMKDPILGGKHTWLGRRTAEILACDLGENEARILAGIYIENVREDQQPNTLQIMHPGNCEITPLPPDIRTKHPDEPAEGEGVFFAHYGRAFTEKPDGTVWQRHVLTAWDTWTDATEEEQVHLWEGATHQVHHLHPAVDRDEHVPFTAWELSGFNSRGSYLIYFLIRLLPVSFKRFVRDAHFFTIDGPRGLLCRIHHDIKKMGEAEAETWLPRLELFRSFIDPGEGYDVIIIQKGSAVSAVTEKDTFHIVQAPEQKCSYAVRYITKSPSFCLGLRVAAPPTMGGLAIPPVPARAGAEEHNR